MNFKRRGRGDISDEVDEVSSQPIVAVVVVALDGGLLDGPVHAFHFPLVPGMDSALSADVRCRTEDRP